MEYAVPDVACQNTTGRNDQIARVFDLVREVTHGVSHGVDGALKPQPGADEENGRIAFSVAEQERPENHVHDRGDKRHVAADERHPPVWKSRNGDGIMEKAGTYDHDHERQGHQEWKGTH